MDTCLTHMKFFFNSYYIDTRMGKAHEQFGGVVIMLNESFLTFMSFQPLGTMRRSKCVTYRTKCAMVVMRRNVVKKVTNRRQSCNINML